MKKTILITVLFVTAFLVFANKAPLEARHHHRHARVEVGVRGGSTKESPTIVRRYVAPMAAVPVYPVVGYYTPGYIAPEYLYAAPVYPGYVEEVYTVKQRPVALTGLSFSLNFFR